MRDQAGRVENCVLRWFGHVEHMDGERMARRIYDPGLEGGRGRGRPHRWIDGVVAARTIAHDRPVWKH